MSANEVVKWQSASSASVTPTHMAMTLPPLAARAIPRACGGHHGSEARGTSGISARTAGKSRRAALRCAFCSDRSALPVYACFTTEDIHASRKIDRNKFKEYAQKPSFGYFECYDCRGLFDYWLERLLVLQEAESGEQEINCVKKAIQKCLGADGCNIIEDMVLRPVRGKLPIWSQCWGNNVARYS